MRPGVGWGGKQRSGIVASGTIPRRDPKPRRARLTLTPGRHFGVGWRPTMLWIIILIVAIAAILYTQRERLSNLRR
jgi:hypothetical protein